MPALWEREGDGQVGGERGGIQRARVGIQAAGQVYRHNPRPARGNRFGNILHPVLAAREIGEAIRARLPRRNLLAREEENIAEPALNRA